MTMAVLIAPQKESAECQASATDTSDKLVLQIHSPIPEDFKTRTHDSVTLVLKE